MTDDVKVYRYDTITDPTTELVYDVTFGHAEETTDDGFDQWLSNVWQPLIATDGFVLYIADVEDDSLAGFIWAHESALHIDGVTGGLTEVGLPVILHDADFSARGRGVETALINEVVADASSTLVARVAAADPDAAFFEAAGFTAHGTDSDGRPLFVR